MNPIKIIPRSEWGARPPKQSRVSMRPKRVVIHHSADPTPSKSMGRSSEERRMREIQAFHQDTRGWSDIAYHILIFPSGRAYRGRPLKTIPACVENNNTGSVCICFVGNYDVDKPSDASVKTLKYLLNHNRNLQGLPVFGHRDFNQTACPGRYLYPLTKKF